MTLYYETIKTQLLDAALAHVPFDGWSEATFQAAIRDVDVTPAVARSVCPRGAIDLAVAFHTRGDTAMLERIQSEDMNAMKFREKVEAAVRFRIEAITDKEAVRRGTSLFALPMYTADGAKLVWGTADHIWTALGDTSDDVNWYTKRATLSGVYSATVLYWLGDDSPDNMATWSFLDRRIEDVMKIEKLKARVRESPILSRLMVGPSWMMSHIKAPPRMPKMDLPGRWTAPRER